MTDNDQPAPEPTYEEYRRLARHHLECERLAERLSRSLEAITSYPHWSSRGSIDNNASYDVRRETHVEAKEAIAAWHEHQWPAQWTEHDFEMAGIQAKEWTDASS